MKSLDTLNDLPEIGSEVSLTHPLSGTPVQGTIAVYTCSQDFGHVDGVDVLVGGVCVDCRLCDVEVL